MKDEVVVAGVDLASKRIGDVLDLHGFKEYTKSFVEIKTFEIDRCGPDYTCSNGKAYMVIALRDGCRLTSKYEFWYYNFRGSCFRYSRYIPISQKEDMDIILKDKYMANSTDKGLVYLSKMEEIPFTKLERVATASKLG